jgi:hypothetical protein
MVTGHGATAIHSRSAGGSCARDSPYAARCVPEYGFEKIRANGMSKKAHELAGSRLNPTAFPDEAGFDRGLPSTSRFPTGVWHLTVVWAKTPYPALRIAPLTASTRLFLLRFHPKPPDHTAVFTKCGRKMPDFRIRRWGQGVPRLWPLFAESLSFDKTPCLAVSRTGYGRLRRL